MHDSNNLGKEATEVLEALKAFASAKEISAKPGKT
jgi:hypothetical protein